MHYKARIMDANRGIVLYSLYYSELIYYLWYEHLLPETLLTTTKTDFTSRSQLTEPFARSQDILKTLFMGPISIISINFYLQLREMNIKICFLGYIWAVTFFSYLI